MRTKYENTRRTKIVATMGPASRTPERVRELILAGVNVFRLNFSHGSHQEHFETFNTIRNTSAELGFPVAILQDLSGPKLRITNIKGEFAPIATGAKIEIAYLPLSSTADTISTAERVVIQTVNPADFLKIGERVLLADGILELVVEGVGKDTVQCSALRASRIRSRVGIAFPDSRVSLPATTSKDLEDFAWGLKHDVDYVAVSFVQNANDLLNLRTIMAQHKSEVKLIAKIERPVALDNINEILDASDGLMVARGDLGLELPLEKVPQIQTKLIELCNDRGIPVIVATQMLSSMVTSTRPTRAEVTDVSFAVTSGADAVMLSEETAIGEHPAACVDYLNRIAIEAEQSLVRGEAALRSRKQDRLSISDAVAYAACAAAVKIQPAAIVSCTATGTAARLVSKYRPEAPIFGVSNVDGTLRRMGLMWGVIPLKAEVASAQNDEIDQAVGMVKQVGNFRSGSRVIVTGGRVVQNPGSTSRLEIREL